MKKFQFSILLLVAFYSYSQIPSASSRTEGDGPFEQLIIRGATLINGNGAPPIGPVDIVIEQNRIMRVNRECNTEPSVYYIVP